MIAVERPGGGAPDVVWLDRPTSRNALRPDDLRALADAVRDDSPSAGRALLIAGRGPVFSAGFDLKHCCDEPGTIDRLLDALADALNAITSSSRPVVIAAHGAAIAGACALLGPADLVVTDRGAKLGYPVVRLGLSPAISAPTMSPAHGARRALLLDPALVDGGRALDIGLAHELVVRPDEVYPRALELARDLARKPPAALAATRRWLAQVSAIDAALAPRALAVSRDSAHTDEFARRLAELKL